MNMLQDQIGVKHTFHSIPKRIVSLVPSQTELVVDLGLENELVGITKFCIHPKHLKKSKTIIGGTKKVDFEKIIALQPDIIIANKEENTLEIVEELSKICPVWVTDIITIDDNLQMISDFGMLFDKTKEAQHRIDGIKAEVNHFKEFIKDKPIQKVAYFIWANPYMVAGKDTFINEMLQLNKFENIYQDKGRYPEIELSKITSEGNPDFILLSSEPFPFKEEHVSEIKKHINSAKVILVDGELFSWYGSRILKSFDYFKKLHAEI